MEFTIKNEPAEVKRARGRIANAERYGDADHVAHVRSEYVKLRAQLLIQEGQRMLAELRESE